MSKPTIRLRNKETGEIIEVPAGEGIERYRKLHPDRPGSHLWEQIGSITPSDGPAHRRFARGEGR